MRRDLLSERLAWVLAAELVPGRAWGVASLARIDYGRPWVGIRRDAGVAPRDETARHASRSLPASFTD